MSSFYENLGIVLILLFIVLIILLPFIATVVVGIAIANMLHFTGLTWWCFLVLFWFVVSSLCGLGLKINSD